jgi:hypothetical protein
MFLTIIVHYPCDYSVSVNELTMCGDWPKRVKRDIIKGSRGLFKEDNLSVTFVPTISVNQPSLAVALLYCDASIQVSDKLSNDEFEHVVDTALHECCPRKMFCVHMIFCDSTRHIGIAQRYHHG